MGSFPHTLVVSSLDLPLRPGASTEKPSTSSSRDSVVPSHNPYPSNCQATQRTSAGGICTLVSFWASCDLVMRLPRAGVTSRPAKRRTKTAPRGDSALDAARLSRHRMRPLHLVPPLVGLVRRTGTPVLRPAGPECALMVLPAKTAVFESAVGASKAKAAPPRQPAAAPPPRWGNFEIRGSTID